MITPISHHSLATLDFHLPLEREATAPAEVRGSGRDDVQLLVSYRTTNCIEHTSFRRLPEVLRAGDLVVINTSATLPAALEAFRDDGTTLELHLSTRLPADLWLIEARRPTLQGSEPFRELRAGEQLQLAAGAWAAIYTPYRRHTSSTEEQLGRLWVARLHIPDPLTTYLAQHGFPIRYNYVRESWPLSAYQTVYANEPGSAEMPSAGRAFTAEILTQLVAQGVQVAPLVLHTGVASLEDHEPPYEEWYRVPLATAEAVNTTRQRGGRVIAVGTTVVRALESVADQHGRAHPGSGWTDLVITGARGVQLVDGLLTGLHEPRATHLAMLEAFSSHTQLAQIYAEALRTGYLWHEFGDLHLLLP